MRVVVKIAGKEAVPVRAIPFLTDWKRWTPDVLASVFAGTAGRALAISGSVRTFRLVDGAIVQVLPDWWLSFPVNQLAALDERLRAGGEPSAASYDRWRLEALRLLPEAVYVWFEEFTEFHSRDWMRRMRVLGPHARSYPEIVARLQAEGLLGESDTADCDEVPLGGLLACEESRTWPAMTLRRCWQSGFSIECPSFPTCSVTPLQKASTYRRIGSLSQAVR